MNENVTLNAITYLVEMRDFMNVSDLKIVGYSESRHLKYRFVAILEGKEAPIYGT